MLDNRYNVPQTDDFIEEAKPTTLTEAMQYAKDNDDFEPLENMIFTIEKKLSDTIEELKTLRDILHYGNQPFYKSKINKILVILNKK